MSAAAKEVIRRNIGEVRAAEIEGSFPLLGLLIRLIDALRDPGRQSVSDAVHVYVFLPRAGCGRRAGVGGGG